MHQEPSDLLQPTWRWGRGREEPPGSVAGLDHDHSRTVATSGKPRWGCPRGDAVGHLTMHSPNVEEPPGAFVWVAAGPRGTAGGRPQVRTFRVGPTRAAACEAVASRRLDDVQPVQGLEGQREGPAWLGASESLLPPDESNSEVVRRRTAWGPAERQRAAGHSTPYRCLFKEPPRPARPQAGRPDSPREGSAVDLRQPGQQVPEGLFPVLLAPGCGRHAQVLSVLARAALVALQHTASPPGAESTGDDWDPAPRTHRQGVQVMRKGSLGSPGAQARGRH